MKVLLLGPHRNEILDALRLSGDEASHAEEKLCSDSPVLASIDFLISYGYRHIIGREVLKQFPQRAINLHVSLLPWNRGADPNLWSFLEDTPKGVTIHYLDEGLDTGPILVQREVQPASGDTLKTSYERLAEAMLDLFRQAWPDIRAGHLHARPQPPGGSCHRLRERDPYSQLLTMGWDTPVSSLIGKALQQVKRGG